MQALSIMKTPSERMKGSSSPERLNGFTDLSFPSLRSLWCLLFTRGSYYVAQADFPSAGITGMCCELIMA